MNEHFLAVRDLCVSYGTQRVLDRVTLEVARGEFVALLGASGCGKTTLLRSIAGFTEPEAGTLSVAGKDITGLPPDRRNMAFVFQSYALWPHMSVAQNIGYPLKLGGKSSGEIASRVTRIQEMLGLQGLQARKPAELSGGQRQRVALGRALAADPAILLLDEPLSNLDARIRLTVRHEISALQKRLGITTLHVTHDREEAMVMADRIVILEHGRIAQAGCPQEIYNKPASAFVAAFMGAENAIHLDGHLDGARLSLHSPRLSETYVTEAPLDAGASSYVARFRNDAAILLDANRTGEGMRLRGRITQVSYPGGVWRHSVDAGGVAVIVDAPQPHQPGAAVDLLIPRERLFVFPAGPADTPAAPVTH